MSLSRMLTKGKPSIRCLCAARVSVSRTISPSLVRLSQLPTQLLPSFDAVPGHRRPFSSSIPRLNDKSDDDKRRDAAEETKPKRRSRADEEEKASKSETKNEAARSELKTETAKTEPKNEIAKSEAKNEAKNEAAVGRRSWKKTNRTSEEEVQSQTKELIPFEKHVLPIVVPNRPPLPGMVTFFMTSDKEMIRAWGKLESSKAWDRNVVVFMKETREGEAPSYQLMTDTEGVKEIGVACRLESFHITRSEDGERLNGNLYPLFRVKLGQLIEKSQDPVEDSGVLPAQDTGLDVTSFDKASDVVAPIDSSLPWMKGIVPVPDEPYDYQDREVQDLCQKIIEVLDKLAATNATTKNYLNSFSQRNVIPPGANFEKPAYLADFAASLCSGTAEIQAILETTVVKERLKKAYELATRDLITIELNRKISSEANDNIMKRQREYALQEQLKTIKRYLGDEEGKVSPLDKIIAKAKTRNMPENVRQVFDEEVARAKTMEAITTSEFTSTLTYLEWLTNVPWNVYTRDKYDVAHSRQVLDETHHGLEDIKKRILEFISVAKLKGAVNGKIICLVGPPGVGKTSVGKSIAQSLNRKFERISVGGLTDVSEIKGHRRTYVASLPGKFIQALKRAQSQNPVLIIDEIDKIGVSNVHGNPAAALLEVLDPDQNATFQDTYLEVPVDLSKVLFICTANELDTIPTPLLDRMEIIEVPGYLPNEKVAIAEKHLAPLAKKECGLDEVDVDIPNETLEYLVRYYTRESGLRGLKKIIEKIYRKIAFKVASEVKDIPVEPAEPLTAVEGTKGTAKSSADDSTVSNLEEPLPPSKRFEGLTDISIKVLPEDVRSYIGPASYSRERMYDIFPVGVAMGSGYTPVGGVPLFVESILEQPWSSTATPNLKITGHLGDVMKESSSIALSVCRAFMAERFPGNKFFDHARIHLHFPEGATKKDGPSAGITMVTSLLSLALNKPVNPTVCMTGEITLTGKVLPIGGLREKTVAARTAGATTMLFPRDNLAHWEDLPHNLKEGMTGVPVDWYGDVFVNAFERVDPVEVEDIWKNAPPVEPVQQPQQRILADQVPPRQFGLM